MKITQGSRAVVTGAASGFGKALASALAAKGAKVVVSDVNDEGGEKVVAEIKAKGGEAFYQRCDVAVVDEVEALREAAERAYGGTDLIVNNAGFACVGRFDEVPLEDLKAEVDVNLWGVMHGCRAFLPAMRRRQSGGILNVASAAGLLSPPLMGPYNLTKAAVVSLSETLAAELTGSGVSVTVACPTFFRTNIHKSTRAPEKLAKRTQHLVTDARWSADEIAAKSLRAVERGTLYVLPQLDAKLFWGMKRALGGAFPKLMGRGAKSVAGGE